MHPTMLTEYKSGVFLPRKLVIVFGRCEHRYL